MKMKALLCSIMLGAISSAADNLEINGYVIQFSAVSITLSLDGEIRSVTVPPGSIKWDEDTERVEKAGGQTIKYDKDGAITEIGGKKIKRSEDGKIKSIDGINIRRHSRGAIKSIGNAVIKRDDNGTIVSIGANSDGVVPSFKIVKGI